MRKTRFKGPAFLFLATTSLAALSATQSSIAQTAPGADAQQSTDEIATVVVTAQRRAERQQDVPITITVLSAEDLQRAGVDHLSGIAEETPALRFDYSGAFPQPTIRGVGSAVVTSGAGSNIGIYFDGFYNPAPLAADFQLLNVESVQVLKGPQGTLFGHNTTGGAILVNTTKPSQDTGGTVDASYGNYNAQRYDGYFTTGLSRDVAFDVAGTFSKGDGFVHDIVTGSDTDGAYQNWSIRTGIKADLSDKASLLFHYEHTDTADPTSLLGSAYVDANGAALVPGTAIPGSKYATRPYDVAQGGGLNFVSRGNTYQLTGTFDLDIATLTSYTQYSKLASNNDHEDLSYTSIQGAPYFNIGYPVTDELVTQEFLLNSKSEGALKWTAGIFYMDFDEQFGPVYSYFPGTATNTGSSGTDTISAAAYFDATYQALEKLYLTAGVRYSHDDVQDAFFSRPEPPPGTLTLTQLPNLNGHKLSPRAVARYVLTQDSSAYFSFSRGYKSAIYNVGGGSTTPVKPETISAYEVGYKYAAHALSFDLSSYYYDYTNLQVASYTDVNGQPASLVNNAASSRIYGFEGQAQYKLTSKFSVNAGAAYTDAKYSEFKGSPTLTTQCIPPPTPPPGLPPNVCVQGSSITPYGFYFGGSQDEHDADMLRAPKLTANLGARYTTGVARGELALSGNLYYTSKFYFDSSDTYYQKAYTLLGLRAEWTDPSHRYAFALYGNNVTNTHYLSAVLSNNPGVGAFWGSPATFGGQVKVYF